MNRAWEARQVEGLSYPQALARFNALWRHALALGPDPLAHWEDDLDATIAVARAINGLPPR